MDVHVYITNVAKRRPPDNRNPTQDEIAFYLPLLFEEIRLVDPSIVILAGAIPLKSVLDVTGITKVRGQWFSTELMGRSRMVMPVFHPSYLLRNASKKFDMKVRK
jgi:uracil-DNA glycosylase